MVLCTDNADLCGLSLVKKGWQEASL